MPILQAYAINGGIIDKARWEVSSFQNLHIDDTVQVSVKSSDKELLTWIGKNQISNVGVDRVGKEKAYSIIMGFRVAKFRHMIEHGSKELDSLAQIVALNRNIELIASYVLDKDHCDARFRHAVQRSTNPL